MKCRNCGAALEAGRVDRGLGVVTCAHCGGLHALPRASGGAAQSGSRGGSRGGSSDAAPDAAPGVAAGSAVTPPTERPLAPPRPRGFESRPRGGAREISWREGSAGSAVILTLFAGVWIALTVSAGLLFVTPVALPILYYAAVRGFNRNRLRLDDARVSLERGPLPWGGGRSVPRAEIGQVFARERLSRTRSHDDGRARVEVRRSYRVVAVTPDGRELTLVGGLGAPEQALWLEREIERVLGIEDRAVPGAYRG